MTTSHGRVMLGALALLVLGAGCGSGGSKAASQTTSTTGAPGRGAGLQAFRQCMASHGITLPQRPRNTSTTIGSEPPPSDPGGFGPGGSGGAGGPGGPGARFSQPPAGVDAAKYQAALQACQSQLPAPQSNAQFRTALTAYLNCLKSHGVAVGDTSQGRQALSGVDRTSASFKAADQPCRVLLPQQGGQATSTTTAA